MRFEVVDGTRPASIADVRWLEGRIGSDLPEQYRRFLLEEANGGPVDTERSIGHGVSLTNLFGVNRPDEPWLDFEAILAALEDRIFPGFVPIGNTATGDIICISIRKEDRGSIWFWDHDTEPEEEGDPPLFSSLSPVAESFDAFGNDVYPDEEAGELRT